jgi:hypothetical protein
VETELQRFEVERAVSGDDNLTIEHASLRKRRPQRLNHLGEITVQRLLVAALDQDLVAIAEDQGAKTIPLRLENPASHLGQFAVPVWPASAGSAVDRKLHAHVINFPAATPDK